MTQETPSGMISKLAVLHPFPKKDSIPVNNRGRICIVVDIAFHWGSTVARNLPTAHHSRDCVIAVTRYRNQSLVRPVAVPSIATVDVLSITQKAFRDWDCTIPLAVTGKTAADCLALKRLEIDTVPVGGQSVPILPWLSMTMSIGPGDIQAYLMDMAAACIPCMALEAFRSAANQPGQYVALALATLRQGSDFLNTFSGSPQLQPCQTWTKQKRLWDSEIQILSFFINRCRLHQIPSVVSIWLCLFLTGALTSVGQTRWSLATCWPCGKIWPIFPTRWSFGPASAGHWASTWCWHLGRAQYEEPRAHNKRRFIAGNIFEVMDLPARHGWLPEGMFVAPEVNPNIVAGWAPQL